MTTNAEHRRVILEVDDRGRVSLGKVGFRSMQVVADSTGDGGLILHPAVTMTPAEATDDKNPAAVVLLDRAMVSASEGRSTDLGSDLTPQQVGEFAQHLST